MPVIDQKRYWPPAMFKGWQGRCPSCGKGSLFRGYIKVHDQCGACSLPLEPHRADDGPAFFTIMVVGHLIVPLVLMTERLAGPPVWVQGLIWLPATILLTLILLPRIKGALVGVQWALDIRREL